MLGGPKQCSSHSFIAPRFERAVNLATAGRLDPFPAQEGAQGSFFLCSSPAAGLQHSIRSSAGTAARPPGRLPRRMASDAGGNREGSPGRGGSRELPKVCGRRCFVCTHRQLEGFVQEAVALAVKVGVGAARFGHSNPRKPGFLQRRQISWIYTLAHQAVSPVLSVPGRRQCQVLPVPEKPGDEMQGVCGQDKAAGENSKRGAVSRAQMST